MFKDIYVALLYSDELVPLRSRGKDTFLRVAGVDLVKNRPLIHHYRKEANSGT